MALKASVLQGQRLIVDKMEEYRNLMMRSLQRKQFDAVLDLARSSSGESLSAGNPPLGADPLPGLSGMDLSAAWNSSVPGLKAMAGGMENLAASLFLQAMAYSSGGMVLQANEMSGHQGNAPSGRNALEPMTVLTNSIDPPEGGAAGTDAQGDEEDRLGTLSAQFESADAGAGAIGYDKNGGTSYGSFQISSRQGTLKLFLEFLDEHAPHWASRLRAAGPADTGGTQGSMPREWSRIAQEDPVLFESLQEDFIRESHYNKALDEIRRKTGVDANEQSQALQEVLWSTAVQHGPHGAANVFSDAVERIKSSGNEMTEKQLIENIYALRASKFGLSTPRIRAAVQARFREEKGMALAMLGDERSQA